MKIPICEICAKSTALCSGCEEKLKAGRLSELDVKISRLLEKLAETHNMQGADFYKAVDLDKLVLVLTKGDVGVLIGKEGRVVSEISNAVGKKVRIAEVSGDMRKTVSDVLVPVRVLGINTIFGDGKQKYRVRLPRNEMRQLPADVKTLEKALGQLFDAEVMIAFE